MYYCRIIDARTRHLEALWGDLFIYDPVITALVNLYVCKADEGDGSVRPLGITQKTGKFFGRSAVSLHTDIFICKGKAALKK